MNFNLVDESWIPVLRANGHFEKLGIRRALTKAGAIRQIAASNPMDNVALLRFLLAVLMWCKPELSDDDRAQLDGDSQGIPQPWLEKLNTHEAAFNLLGDGKRFYQDATLKDAESRPVADLLVEFPGADSVNHMRHVVHDGSYGFCPACCALGILRLSVWAPANRFYPASVNPGSAAYAFFQKNNLLLTLAANLPEAPAQPDQAPWLLSTPPDSPGAVANLAWRPRKLWLNVAGNGHCAYCGRSGTLVKSLCIEKGWPTPVTTGQRFGKEVLAELQKLNGDYRSKATDRRKLANKVVKIAPVLVKCRMSVLRQADSNASQGNPDEKDAATIARVFDQMYTAGNHETIKKLIKKPTLEEQPQLEREDTQVKKFWVDDPHLLKEAEAIGLPDLNADVALHASKFWRDALRLRAARADAIGIVGDGQYNFHDTLAVSLPGAAAVKLATLTKDCADTLPRLIKATTPNRKADKDKHPEVNSAVVLMTPAVEARVRTGLTHSIAMGQPDLESDRKFLREIYEPVVEQIVASTVPGSPLRRRAAKNLARALLSNKIKELVNMAHQPPRSVDADGSVPAKPRRGGKKKGGDA
ncbi:MAG: type I-E CRISPR-associated protein Cse1/CasA [Planctomycetes bacterium]|nr:type I-E CRISPR-associated protein Cse1/CasA [Planctomycetota bacterium]